MLTTNVKVSIILIEKSRPSSMPDRSHAASIPFVELEITSIDLTWAYQGLYEASLLRGICGFAVRLEKSADHLCSLFFAINMLTEC